MLSLRNEKLIRGVIESVVNGDRDVRSKDIHHTMWDDAEYYSEYVCALNKSYPALLISYDSTKHWYLVSGKRSGYQDMLLPDDEEDEDDDDSDGTQQSSKVLLMHMPCYTSRTSMRGHSVLTLVHLNTHYQEVYDPLASRQDEYTFTPIYPRNRIAPTLLAGSADQTLQTKFERLIQSTTDTLCGILCCMIAFLYCKVNESRKVRIELSSIVATLYRMPDQEAHQLLNCFMHMYTTQQKDRSK